MLSATEDRKYKFWFSQRIEFTTSALVVRGYLLDHSGDEGNWYNPHYFPQVPENVANKTDGHNSGCVIDSALTYVLRARGAQVAPARSVLRLDQGFSLKYENATSLSKFFL